MTETSKGNGLRPNDRAVVVQNKRSYLNGMEVRVHAVEESRGHKVYVVCHTCLLIRVPEEELRPIDNACQLPE